MRENIARLLCIFPFEEAFFAKHRVPASYIGHPLARLVRASATRAELGLPDSARILVLLPGSRHGEAGRHIPDLVKAVQLIRAKQDVHPVMALPKGFNLLNTPSMEPISAASIQVIEGHTWDVLAHSELALAASGTVTMEAALLRVPMVTFYRVNALTWYLGRRLVKAPFLSMVNLVAERMVVPELIQHDMTPERIAAEGLRLLENPAARQEMRAGLAEVAAKLASERDPMEVAADWIETVFDGTNDDNQRAHVA
jgi:lipid-A-disaccharide synthase